MVEVPSKTQFSMPALTISCELEEFRLIFVFDSAFSEPFVMKGNNAMKLHKRDAISCDLLLR